MQMQTKNTLSQFFLSTGLSLVMLSAIAGASPAQKSKVVKKESAECSICDKASLNVTKLKSLKYSSKDDRFKGEELSIDSVSLVEDFEKLKKTDKQRVKAFSSLLPLFRETAPYDPEGQLAISLAKILKENADLKASYESYLKSMPNAPTKGAESCKTQLLKSNVEQNLCSGDEPGKSQDSKPDKKADKCMAPFNYEACIK